MIHLKLIAFGLVTAFCGMVIGWYSYEAQQKITPQICSVLLEEITTNNIKQ